MSTITSTRIVKLTPEEAGKILREALGLPSSATVNFEFGICDDTHKEVTELKPKTTFRTDPSQFEDRDWGER